MRVHRTRVTYATEPGAARVRTDVQRQVPMAATCEQLLCRFPAVRPGLQDCAGGGPKGCVQLLRDRRDLWAAGHFHGCFRAVGAGSSLTCYGVRRLWDEVLGMQFFNVGQFWYSEMELQAKDSTQKRGRASRGRDRID